MSGSNGSKVSIVRLDRIQLQAVLLRVEDLYRDATGTHLSSAEFYKRYSAGEFDDAFTMAWATYYEAFLHTQPQAADEEVEEVMEAFPPAELVKM